MMRFGASRGSHRQDGLTIVELLVVLVILGVIGSVVAGGLIRGQRADAQAQARIEAFEDMRIAMERVSRDVRAASTPLLVAADDEIQLQLVRGGQCIEYTYSVDVDVFRVEERRSPDDNCSNFGASADRVLIPALESSAVFGFEMFDDDGDRVSFPDEFDDIDDISVVTITFTRSLFEQPPVEMSTVVGMRNAS